LQYATVEHLVHVLVWEIAFPCRFSILPDFADMLLQAAESLLFWDARIGDPVIMVFQQVPFVLRTKVAVVGYPFIMRMGDEVHDVLFEVGTGTADDGYFILADHFS